MSRPLTYGSLFSGIEGASVAWEPLGWRCAWVAEIDPFASALLAHRYPEVPNLGDVERIDAAAIEPVDLVVFGSPCQSFSVAGKRLGLDDARGNLALLALGLVARLRPRWLVFENVPGLFSSFSGSEQEERQVREGDVGQCADGAEDRDFAAFLTRVRECGYLGCWRVYDAQFTGVPQRRRRIFFVGHLGDWRPAAAVLLEPESLRGDPAPSRQAGQRTARPVASCPPGGSGYRNDADTADSLIAPEVVARALCGSDGGIDREDRHTLVPAGFNNTGHGWWNDAEAAAATTLRSRDQTRDADTLVASSLRTGGAPAEHSFRGDGSDNLIPLQCNGTNVGTDLPSLRAGNQHITGGGPAVAMPVEADVADPISANEAKTWTHEGENNFRTHNLVYDRPQAFGGNNQTSAIEVATAVRAKGGTGHGDFESETFVTHALDSYSAGRATEDGTGRGAPLVPVAYGISSDAVDRSGEGDGSAAERAGLGIVEEAMPALRARPNNAVAFQASQSGTRLVGDAHPTLDSNNGSRRHHGVVMPILEVGKRTGREGHEDRDGVGIGQEGDPMYTLQAGAHHGVAFKASHYTRDKDGAPSEVVPPLSADADKGDQDMLVLDMGGNKGMNGGGFSEGVTPPLGTNEAHAIAFESRVARNGRGAPDTVVPPLKAQSGESGKGDAAPLVTGFYQNTGSHGGGAYEDASPALKGAGGHAGNIAAVAFTASEQSNGYAWESDVAPALEAHPQSDTSNRQSGVVQMSVRRLTPRECERLQGLPDNYTLIPYRGQLAADGPRYRAIGNGFAVPQVRWIGKRIAAFEAVRREE